MKSYKLDRIVLIAIICILSTNLISQTYQLVSLFSDKVTETHLSHWKILETSHDAKNDTFSLWGYQLFYDDWVNGAYEVEYFKGNAKEVFQLLIGINQFTEKYRDEDQILTHIQGVQVKTFKRLGFKFTFVYDKERKVTCKFNQKQWSEMLTQFISYCRKLNIPYEME